MLKRNDMLQVDVAINAIARGPEGQPTISSAFGDVPWLIAIDHNMPPPQRFHFPNLCKHYIHLNKETLCLSKGASERKA